MEAETLPHFGGRFSALTLFGLIDSIVIMVHVCWIGQGGNAVHVKRMTYGWRGRHRCGRRQSRSKSMTRW
jgi:hypothetical protein